MNYNKERSRVLVIGGGGREHALVWKLKQSEFAEKIYCAPGNGGISGDAEVFGLPSEFADLKKIIEEKKIDMVVVGPEAPLVDGIADYLGSEGVTVFGPLKGSARLEGSKIYSKEFMKRHAIPTAGFDVFDDASKAMDYLKSRPEVVIKADGLCAGKGVVVTDSFDEGRETIEKFMTEKIFGNAGRRVVIEEKLKGEEASILALVSGKNCSLLIPSQDHKAVFEGDTGPNTGGMGAYAPASLVDSNMLDKVKKQIIVPVLEGLASEGMDYCGVLYAGLMICAGEPKVLEFNVRFGDPETEAVLPMMKSDLLEAIYDLNSGIEPEIEWKKGVCMDIVIASGGYPGHYEKGKKITIKDIPDDVYVFHAATEERNGMLYTSGGRVLNVAAVGDDIKSVKEKVYNAVSNISFDGMYYRRDIGWKELARQKKKK
ncbi:MAG: phosphoribosylamine--glycine ligase [Elusimicrobiota bacterium]